MLKNKTDVQHESDRLNILKFPDVLPENLLYQNATLAAVWKRARLFFC